MNNTMEYKGYIGSVEFSEADAVFHGKVQGIRALISYEGTNAQELVEDFHTTPSFLFPTPRGMRRRRKTRSRYPIYAQMIWA